MPHEIRIVEESLAGRELATNSIAEVLPRVVNAERHDTFEAHAYPASDIELSVAGELGDVTAFNVNTWLQTASNQAPSVIQPHEFLVQLVSDMGRIPLDNQYLVRPDGTRYKLTPPEALFFLGLSFKAIAARHTAQK